MRQETPDAGTVEGCSPSNGSVCPATRWSVGLMRSVKASKAGQSASASAWGFSGAAADTASPAAPATS